RFFSYRRETIAEFVDDPALRRRCAVVPPPLGAEGRLAGLTRAVLDRRALAGCSVLRAFQAPGALPALALSIPLVTTYGYSYLDVSRCMKRPAAEEAVR